jgi:beta-glucoside operon transcriptional antiterminator
MKVIKRINNNVAICSDDNNHEVIAFGKGIGFRKPPYYIELSQIDRTYYNLDSHYVALLDEIPEEVINVTFEIVEKGIAYLEVNLNRNFWFSLCDHINFAIENAKKGLVISNPMINEIQHLYEKELLLGKWAIKHIEKKLSIKLPQNEAGSIALHFINAQQLVKKDKYKDNVERFIEDITDIIESEMNIIIDHNNFSYSRFVTHLKYLLKRSDKISKSKSDNCKMYEKVLQEFPEMNKIINKINNYMIIHMNIKLNEEELLYIIMHINRLCVRDGL